MPLFQINAEEVQAKEKVQELPKKPPEAKKSIEPFTGKITRNKVRMRLQPSLEAPILSELSRDDLLSVVGENEEFYAILPPKETKAYVYRTYVLDNVVEGNRVNVRLEPALEAPVIGQLNNGDRIEGNVSPLNSKWLEIAPPSSTRFYVCKEYVEKIGSPAMLAQLEKRRTEVSALLSSAHLISDNELQKTYLEINLDAAISNLNTVVKQYQDFPKHVERAKNLLASIQENYLQKKIAYLEAKAMVADSQKSINLPKEEPPKEILQKDELSKIDQSVAFKEDFPKEPQVNHFNKRVPDWNTPFDPATMTSKMAIWVPTERALYDTWASQQQNNSSPKDFYEQQFSDSISLKGIVESYSRAIRNKPGDYLLVNPATKLPIAYLYSTRINLQENLGQEVTLHAVPRPNNNFAFPAYFVISAE